jgi:hypothetical protein
LHGSGRDNSPRVDLENEAERRLAKSGWDRRGSVIVVAPELEIWVWSDSPHVDDILGWKDQEQSLKNWLIEEGHLKENATKPDDPKTAFLDALRKVRKPRSASLFAALAKCVSVDRCRDPAFKKLRTVLGKWFPPTTTKTA